MKGGFLARTQHDLGGDYLEGSGWTGSGPFFGRGLGGHPLIFAFLAEAIQMARGLDEDFAVVSGRGAEAPAVESEMGQDLGFGAGLDDIKSAGGAGFASVGLGGWVVEHGDVELAVGEQRTGIALFDAELQLPKDRTVVGVDGAEIALLSNQVNGVAGENRCTRGG